MKIIFMGTPEFAVPTLDILIKAQYNIVAVITAPDRLGGRGRKTLIESAVKKHANELGLTVLQPKNLKSPKFIEKLKTFEADLQIVLAFRMLPEVVWNMPVLGTYNLHGSLLPKYRGAAPLNWAIIKGENITGVTSFKLKHAIDTGSLLLQKETPIYPFDKVGDLHDRLKWLAADVVYESVKLIEKGEPPLKEQDEKEVSHAPKLNSENTQLDFTKKSVDLYNQIRGLSPYPTAWFNFNNKKVKVFDASMTNNTVESSSKNYVTDYKSHLYIKTGDGYISINELQISGKKRMSIKEFMNGIKDQSEMLIS